MSQNQLCWNGHDVTKPGDTFQILWHHRHANLVWVTCGHIKAVGTVPNGNSISNIVITMDLCKTNAFPLVWHQPFFTEPKVDKLACSSPEGLISHMLVDELSPIVLAQIRLHLPCMIYEHTIIKVKSRSYPFTSVSSREIFERRKQHVGYKKMSKLKYLWQNVFLKNVK